jgi:hypothetical protein
MIYLCIYIDMSVDTLRKYTAENDKGVCSMAIHIWCQWRMVQRGMRKNRVECDRLVKE